MHTWRRRIVCAVVLKDFELFNRLMKDTRKYSLDFRIGQKGDTPLCGAVLMNNYKFAHHILRAGADVNFLDGTGRSPLMKAIERSDVSMFRLLVFYGASMHATPGYHSQVMDIYTAADHKLEAAVLDNGQEIQGYQDTLTKGSPVGAAIYYRNNCILKHILEQSEAVRNRLPLGLLFNWAIASYSWTSAIILIQHGYYPTKNSSQDYTSCFQAAVLKKDIILVIVLAKLSPKFVQEQWFIEKQFSTELLDPNVISLLDEYRKQAPCLQKLCKCTILAQLSPYYTLKITHLPLPTALKNFLRTVEFPEDC